MKNQIRVFAAVMAMLLLLSACAPAQEEKPAATTAPTGSAPVETTPAETTPSEEPTEPAENEQDTSVLEPEKVYVPAYLPELYDLDLTAELDGCMISNAWIRGNYMLLWLCENAATTEEDYLNPKQAKAWLCLFSLTKGTVIAKQELTDYLFSVELLDNGLTLCWRDETGEKFLLDRNLEELDLPQLPYGTYLGASDGVIWSFSDAGFLNRTNIETGESDMYELESGTPDRLIKELSGKAYFAMYNDMYESTLWELDLASGEMQEAQSLRSFPCFTGDTVFFPSVDRWYYASVEDPYQIASFPKYSINEQQWRVLDGTMISDEYIYDFRDDGSFSYTEQLRVYDQSNGGCIGTISTEDFAGWDRIQVLDYRDGLEAIAACMDSGAMNVYLWDIRSMTADPDPEFVIMDNSGEDNAETAARMEEKYGIEICYEEIDFARLDVGYDLTVSHDVHLIAESLAELDKCLSIYPEGFFEELRGLGNTGAAKSHRLKIYLTEEIKAASADRPSYPAGITSIRGDHVEIALDMRGYLSFKSTVAHELCHAMDFRFAEFAVETGDKVLDFWETELNDPERPYYMSYSNENGEQYSDLAGYGILDQWFLDNYARTYPTEDRARVFEYLVSDSAAFADRPHLVEKARFLCALIRRAFPSVAACDEPMAWEQLTGICGYSDYSANMVH